MAKTTVDTPTGALGFLTQEQAKKIQQLGRMATEIPGPSICSDDHRYHRFPEVDAYVNNHLVALSSEHFKCPELKSLDSKKIIAAVRQTLRYRLELLTVTTIDGKSIKGRAAKVPRSGGYIDNEWEVKSDFMLMTQYQNYSCPRQFSIICRKQGLDKVVPLDLFYQYNPDFERLTATVESRTDSNFPELQKTYLRKVTETVEVYRPLFSEGSFPEFIYQQ